MTALLDNQQSAIDKLRQYKVGALFMEPGTGKTRSTIELVRSVDSDYICWFAPFQTKSNLREEFNKWGFECEIVGIESIQNSDRIYLDVHTKLRNANKPFLIVDESLKIKNVEAKRTKRILTLSKLVEYKLILNGTPISRNILDLWSQIDFLSPTILNMGIAEFKNTFCEYKTMTIKKQGTYRKRTKEWIIKYHNMDYLYELIDPYVYECDLKLGINTHHIDVPFSLDETTKTNHENILNQILNNSWLMAKPNFFLELIQKLQNNYSRSKDKFEVVKRILSTNDKSKVIIFAKYIKTQNLLKQIFPDVQIMSFQKHAYGLNLQKYNRTIYFDKIWDYALLEQSQRRTYRVGQEEDCMFYNLTGNVGLETMIDKNIDKKSDILRELKKISLEQFKKQAK